VVVAEGVHLERPEASETQRSGGVGAPRVLSVAEGVHLERPAASETQRSSAGNGSRPLSGRRLARPSGAVGVVAIVYPVAGGVHLSGRSLANPSGAVGSGPLVGARRRQVPAVV